MWLTNSRFMTWQYPGVVSVRLQSYLVEGHQLQGTTACLLLLSSENTQLMLHSLGRGHRAQNLSLLCVKALKNLSCRASHPWKCETSGKKLLLTVLFTRQKKQVSWGQLCHMQKDGFASQREISYSPKEAREDNDVFFKLVRHKKPFCMQSDQFLLSNGILFLLIN